MNKISMMCRSEETMFSDSDDDETMDTNKSQVNHMIPSFNAFLSAPSMNNKPGDETTNIVDRYRKKCLNIGPSHIPRFFKFLETARLKGLRQMFNEKQLPYSGIMLDFDIKQSSEVRQISHLQHFRLCQTVCLILSKYLAFKTSRLEIKIGFTTKNKPKKSEDKTYYKDGFHMLIPGIKVSRAFKKMLIALS